MEEKYFPGKKEIGEERTPPNARAFGGFLSFHAQEIFCRRGLVHCIYLYE